MFVMEFSSHIFGDIMGLNELLWNMHLKFGKVAASITAVFLSLFVGAMSEIVGNIVVGFFDVVLNAGVPFIIIHIVSVIFIIVIGFLSWNEVRKMNNDNRW